MKCKSEYVRNRARTMTGVVCFLCLCHMTSIFFWLARISLDRPTSVFIHFQLRSQKPGRKLFYLFSLATHVAITNSILRVTPEKPINYSWYFNQVFLDSSLVKR